MTCKPLMPKRNNVDTTGAIFLAQSCRRCGVIALSGDLRQNSGKRNGVDWQCKRCDNSARSGYYASNRAAQLEYQRKYRVENGDKRRAYHRRTYAQGTHTIQRQRSEDPEGASGYASAHYRIRRLRGSASDHPCALCDSPAASWALSNVDRTVKRSRHYTWSDDPDAYVSLCNPCHARYDAAFRRTGASEVPAEADMALVHRVWRLVRDVRLAA